jgi:hypothetical protein
MSTKSGEAAGLLDAVCSCSLGQIAHALYAADGQ